MVGRDSTNRLEKNNIPSVPSLSQDLHCRGQIHRHLLTWDDADILAARVHVLNIKKMWIARRWNSLNQKPQKISGYHYHYYKTTILYSGEPTTTLPLVCCPVLIFSQQRMDLKERDSEWQEIILSLLSQHYSSLRRGSTRLITPAHKAKSLFCHLCFSMLNNITRNFFQFLLVII